MKRCREAIILHTFGILVGLVQQTPPSFDALIHMRLPKVLVSYLRCCSNAGVSEICSTFQAGFLASADSHILVHTFGFRVRALKYTTYQSRRHIVSERVLARPQEHKKTFLRVQVRT